MQTQIPLQAHDAWFWLQVSGAICGLLSFVVTILLVIGRLKNWWATTSRGRLEKRIKTLEEWRAKVINNTIEIEIPYFFYQAVTSIAFLVLMALIIYARYLFSWSAYPLPAVKAFIIQHPLVSQIISSIFVNIGTICLCMALAIAGGFCYMFFAYQPSRRQKLIRKMTRDIDELKANLKE